MPCSSFIITVLVILGCLCSTSLFLAWTQVSTTPKNLLYLTVLYILVSSKVDFLFLYGYAYIMLQSGCQNIPTKKNPHIVFFFTMFCVLDFTVRFVFLVGQCEISVCICICIYVDTPSALRPFFSSPFPGLKPGWGFIYCLV